MDITYLLIVAAILIAGWFLYQHDMKKKPLEHFTESLESRNWRRYEHDIRQLQKRGLDVSGYLPQVVSLLAGDSKLERAMGQRVIEMCYPEVAGELSGYSYMNDVAECQASAATLLADEMR
jgi:hypothetical protein